MSKEVPWYLQSFTGEERRRYAADPWRSVPEHLRPRFLESETQIKIRLALEAAKGGVETVARKSYSWMDSPIRKFLQKAEADAIPAVELKRIEKPDPETLALISELELMKRETAWRDRERGRKEENMELTKDEMSFIAECVRMANMEGYYILSAYYDIDIEKVGQSCLRKIGLSESLINYSLSDDPFTRPAPEE